MKCSSCGKAKKSFWKNSKLMPGTKFLVCEDCVGMEPRYLVLIYGRQNGLNATTVEFIKKRRYHGDPILASELV